jgi:RNA polymerase sigma-70 factor, ECF subfamily
MEHLSDYELMELVKHGDFVAFDALYDRYSGPIRKFLFSLTWDQDTAEDYLQEVFLRVYRARENYQATGKFSSYIYRIAKNYYLGQCRRNGRREEVSLAQENRNGFRPFESIRANERIEPEVHLLEAYRRLNIRRAILALPEAQRLVFVMSHMEDMKYDQIAEILRVPLGTVKSRMHAAVSTLRKTLAEECTCSACAREERQ